MAGPMVSPRPATLAMVRPPVRAPRSAPGSGGPARRLQGKPSEEGKPLRQAGSLSQAGNPRWVAIEPIWQISGGETLSRLFSLPFEGTHAQSA